MKQSKKGFTKLQRSIFRKYFIITAGILLVSFVVFSTILMVFSQSQWTNEKNSLLSKNVKTISNLLSSTSDGFSYDAYQIYSTVDAVGEIIDADIFVVNSNGKCIYSTSFAPGQVKNGDIVNKNILARALDSKYMEKGTLGGLLANRSFVVSFPVVGSGNIATGAVFASIPLQEANNYLTQVFKIIVFGAAVVMMLAFIATYIASAQMTRPLRYMVRVVKNMEKGDFTQKVPVTTLDEIGLLAEAINKMSVSIGALEGMRRSFISSVSHELKTPMTTISGFVDGILDGTIPPEDSSKYLSIVSAETKRLSRLVNSMLSLSRLESENMKLNKTSFNFTDMIISVFLSFEQKIEQKNLEIKGLDQFKTVMLTADRDLIYQVVYNLTENAIKFTPEGGYISVGVTTENQVVGFSIENSGQGLQKHEMAKIFERFYKTDRSRSEDKTGMGFGLYIVKTIVGLHNGKITVGSVVGKFTKFDLTLPDNEVVAELDKRSNNNER